MSPFLSRSNFKFSYWKNVEKINRFVKTNSLGIFLNPFYRSKNEEKTKIMISDFATKAREKNIGRKKEQNERKKE